MIDFLACSKKVFDARFFDAVAQPPSTSGVLGGSKVFKILDLDDDGALDADEFLSGCLRLRGPAKTLDVLVARRKIRYKKRCFFSAQESIIPNSSPEIGGITPHYWRFYL